MNYLTVHELYYRVSSVLLGDLPRSRDHLLLDMKHLEQALSCYVCYSPLVDPCSVPSSQCQHYVCSSCIGGRLRMPSGGRTSCSWCKNSALFRPDRLLESLLVCYANLKEFAQVAHYMPLNDREVESTANSVGCRKRGNSTQSVAKRVKSLRSWDRNK